MREFIMLMHSDSVTQPSAEMWQSYFAFLSARGVFDGGSSIGEGKAFRRQGSPAQPSDRLGGFIRIRALSLAEAEELLKGNPVFECGGTVEIRELPRD